MSVFFGAQVTITSESFRGNDHWIWCSAAVDFIQKPFRDQELLYCIGEALKTNQTLREARLRKSEIAERLGKLSKHEREVFDRVVTGKPNKIIAYELDVSDRAVEIHRGRVIKKMQARLLAILIRMHLSV